LGRVRVDTGQILSLPDDSIHFQWNRNTVIGWHYPSCKIGGWPPRRHCSAIGIIADCAIPLTRTLHLLACRAVVAIGIQFHSHRMRVKLVEINLDLKHEMIAVGMGLHFTEAHPKPVLIDRVPPFDQILAHRSPIRRTRQISRRTRQVVCSVYSRTARSAENCGVNRAMLSRIRATQAVGMPF